MNQLSLGRKVAAISLIQLIASVFLLACEKDKAVEPLGLILLDSTSLSFMAPRRGPLPDEKSFTLANGGGQTLNWSVDVNVNWLSVAPMSGQANSAILTTAISTTELTLGTYYGIISVMSTNAVNSPETIQVTLDVVAPTLVGSYDGLYQVVSSYQTPTADTVESTVVLQLSDVSYWFNSDNNPDAFCSPRGDYVISDNVMLSERIKNCTVSASEANSPRGEFSYRLPADSLVLRQAKTDTLKQLLLVKR